MIEVAEFIKKPAEGYPQRPLHLVKRHGDRWTRTSCGREIRTVGYRQNATVSEIAEADFEEAKEHGRACRMCLRVVGASDAERG